jgi:hypothetical protein
MESDTGFGPMWWILMGTLTFPLGTAGGVIAFMLLASISGQVLGDGWHFSSVSEVCFCWMAMFFLGHLQWFRWFGREAPQQSDSEPNESVRASARPRRLRRR